MSSTLQKDEHDQPLLVFHYSDREITDFRFMPLTHFGTCQSAHERWHGYAIEGAQFYPCVLQINNPLEVEDSRDLDIRFGPQQLIQAGLSAEKVRWVFQPALIMPIMFNDFDAQAAKHESWGVVDFSPKVSINCLASPVASLVDVWKWNILMPLTNKDVENEVKFKRLGNLRHFLVAQRAGEALKEIGFDGLVYKNDEEDPGSLSYCIFDPDQVVSAFDIDWGDEGMPKQSVKKSRNFLSIQPL